MNEGSPRCLLPVVMTAALLAGQGCASQGNSRAGNADDVAAALARSRPVAEGPVNRTRQPLVFLSLADEAGARLAAFDLGGSKLLWNQPAELTSRVEVGPDVVVHAQKQAGLVARDITSGAVLWQRPLTDGERLMGYAVDEGTVFAVVQSGGGDVHAREAAVLALDARTGGGRWRHEMASGSVGGLAVRGGLVAVPMQSQYVVILDGATGKQLAQLLSSEEAAVFVRALPEGIFYGSRGIFLVDPRTAGGSRKSPGYLQATLPPFVRPFYHHDMYRPEQMDYSAIDRNRILWRIDVTGENPAFRGGMAVVHNYRFFFALDARSGELRWAYNQPNTEAVASTDTGRGILFVTADGELGALDRATGRRVYKAQLPGLSVRGATFDAEGALPSGGVDDSPGEAGTLSTTLASTLSSIIWDRDRRFGDVKIFALEQLARQPGKEVTADLLKISQTEGMASAVTLKAGEALVARKDGSAAELFAAALKVHSDYAEDLQPQGVDVLARVVAGLGKGEGRALAAVLAEHLRLPETQPGAVVQISRALATLGATESLPVLRDFISMYRADPAYDVDPAPLIAVAEALTVLGGPAERQLLLFVAEEPMTTEPLRSYLRRVLIQGPAVGGGPVREAAKE